MTSNHISSREYSKSKFRDKIKNNNGSRIESIRSRKELSEPCVCGSKECDTCRARKGAKCYNKSQSSSSVCSDSESVIVGNHYDNTNINCAIGERKSHFSKRRKSDKSTVIGPKEDGIENSCLMSGKEKKAIKIMQYEGQEILQIVEELMEQTLILKNRLADMINYFQSTVCTCSEKMCKTLGNNGQEQDEPLEIIKGCLCPAERKKETSQLSDGSKKSTSVQTREEREREDGPIRDVASRLSQICKTSTSKKCEEKEKCPGTNLQETSALSITNKKASFSNSREEREKATATSWKEPSNLSKISKKSDLPSIVEGSPKVSRQCSNINSQDRNKCGIQLRSTSEFRNQETESCQCLQPAEKQKPISSAQTEKSSSSKFRKTCKVSNKLTRGNISNYLIISPECKNSTEPSKKKLGRKQKSTLTKGKIVSATSITNGNNNAADDNCNKNTPVESSRSKLKSSEYRIWSTGTKEAKIVVIETDEEIAKCQHPDRSRARFLEENPSLYRSSNHANLTQKVYKVQQDIEQLRRQMLKFQSCNCHNTKADSFPQSISTQLLRKADEIQNLLRHLKSDCWQRVKMSQDELPDNGEQKVSQKCQKDIRRVHPEFTRTINQIQKIEGDCNRTANVRTAKIVEALETNVDTKYKNQDTPKSFQLKSKAEANERIEDMENYGKNRETKAQSERTIQIADKSIREMNTINERDYLNENRRIIDTTKKVVRTETIDEQDPREQIIANIKIRRVVDDLTVKISETLTDADKDSNEVPAYAKSERICFDVPAVEEPLILSEHEESNESFSVFIGKRSYEDSEPKIQKCVLQEASASKKMSTRNDPSSIEEPSPLSKKMSDRTNRPASPSSMMNNNRMQNKATIQSKSESLASMPKLHKKRRYGEEEPPVKSQRTSGYYTCPDTSAGNQSWISFKSNGNFSEDGPDYSSRATGGATPNSACSKVVYVAPNSEVEGVEYIGCKDSDMSKYSSKRSKVTADKRLLTNSVSSNKTNRLHDPNRYLRTQNTSYSRCNQHSDKKDVGEAVDQSNFISHHPCKKNPSTHSNVSKPYFRECNNSMDRAPGGTSIQQSHCNDHETNQYAPESPASYFTQKEELSRSVHTTLVQPAHPQAVDNIVNIIVELSGNRSPKDFFVSVLPEKLEAKSFRINVIDKESGNMLGYFFIDERKFQQARDEGVFDNYLSLFVLNSLGSYSDFVRMKSSINPKGVQRHQCFGKCSCQQDRSG